LDEVNTGFKIHRLWTDGNINSDEYFLIENRQLSGFDEFLPGSGLLIWHIDNTVQTNIDEHHPKIKLIQADGLAGSKGNWGRGDAGDSFPGFAAVSTFNVVTKPSSKSYSGLDTYVSVTNIPTSARSMTFNVTVKRENAIAGPNLNTRTWYRLKNAHMPDTQCVDVINENGINSVGHMEMRGDGNYSGQHWHIRSNGDGTYFLRTLFLGPNRQLDVHLHDKSTPVLQTFAHTTGQYWQIKPWGDGMWHLENAYNGPFQYLDVVDGGTALKMAAANSTRATQRWSFEPLREVIEPGYYSS
jgi:immune inhibitor A